MDKAKRIDRLKNIVIALLLVPALYLLYRAVFYEKSFSADTPFGASDTAQAQTDPAGAAVLSEKPAYLLVTGMDLTHTAAKYDDDARERLLSQFSAPLGEALGSAGDPKQVDIAQWQAALRGRGVFYDYLWPHPLSVAASSLGTTANGAAANASARRLLLSVEEGGVRLYYVSTDNTIWCCTTALSAASLLAKLTDYHSGEAKFAFEQDSEYKSLDPYFIFSGEDAKLDALIASTPLPDSAKLFPVFGMNSRASSGNIEKGGSIVYVEGSKILRIDTTGGVLFSVTGKKGVPIGAGKELTQEQIVAACAAIAEKVVGCNAGVAQLVLMGCETDEDAHSVNIEFGYAVGGIPVTASSGAPAATFKVSGSTITRAEFNFRKYVYAGETLTALPETQAAAIALSSGGEPVLTYDDRSDGVAASWIVK